MCAMSAPVSLCCCCNGLENHLLILPRIVPLISAPYSQGSVFFITIIILKVFYNIVLNLLGAELSSMININTCSGKKM
jgi:hypothetical protein